MTSLAPRLALLLLVLAPLAPAQDAPARVATERFYEVFRNGKKLGHSKVAWAPSTWQGKRTLHDTTTTVTKSVRNMGGHKDVFESVQTLDLERDEDGTLWWQRVRSEEGGREIVEELTWTGQGYEHVTTVDGAESQRLAIPLDAPVMTDAESALGPLLRAGRVKPGDVVPLRELDVRARAARTSEVTILPPEQVQGEAGPLTCTPVRQRDPASGTEVTLWLDQDGAFVQLRDDTGAFYQRSTREKATDMPVRPAESSIMVPALPTVERVFTAARLGIEVRLQGDPHRKLPEFPPSPWSKAGAPRGSDAAGWIIPVELTAYDDVAATSSATFADVDRKAFAADLEPTVLMPCDHPELVAAARTLVGDSKTLREAARRLVRFVYGHLEKGSPAVSEATALQILRDQQGDCSEHCTLFVALCRAAGIPARRASGWACLGSVWGAHAFAEIWVGAWIGADPTTGELGAGARYLFFGYPDGKASYPTVISSRISDRMRIVITSVTAPADEGGETYDLTDERTHRQADDGKRRYVNALAGLEARDVPADWSVDLLGPNVLAIHGPTINVHVSAMADQGAELDQWGGPNGTFCGVPAHVEHHGRHRTILVHDRRRIVQVSVGADDAAYEMLQRVLAPTFGKR